MDRRPTITYQYIRPPDRVSTFTADLMAADDRMMVMELTLDRAEPLLYHDEVVATEGYRCVWFLLNGEAYDIAAIYRPDGPFTGYYVDVLERVQWDGGDPSTVQPIVDLFLDVWIAPDGGYAVLDEDEFEEAAEKGWITSDQVDHAKRVLREIEDGIRSGAFPPAQVRAPGVST